MIHTDNWVNVEEQHRLTPDTFTIPSKIELDRIAPGYTVKICNGFERFFCEVESIKDDVIIGRVDNILIRKYPYKYGDRVKFKKKNIYMIYSVDYLKENGRKILSIYERISKQKGVPVELIAINALNKMYDESPTFDIMAHKNRMY